MSITQRELDVLRLVGCGLTDGEIAVRLAIKRNTVTSHMRKLLRKLDAANRTFAVVLACEQGWLHLDDLVATGRANHR